MRIVHGRMGFGHGMEATDLLEPEGAHGPQFLLHDPEVLIQHLHQEDVLLLGLSLTQGGGHRRPRLQDVELLPRRLLYEKFSVLPPLETHERMCNLCPADLFSATTGM